MKFWVSGAFLLVCVLTIVNCHPAEAADRVAQGFRDVVTDHGLDSGKDYRYSSEDGHVENYAKVKRSVQVEEPLTNDAMSSIKTPSVSDESVDDDDESSEDTHSSQNDKNDSSYEYLTDEQENASSEVNGNSEASHPLEVTSNQPIGNGEEDTVATLEKPPTERSKRSTDELEAYRDKMLEKLNQYREDKRLPLLEVDYGLEQGAQAWAEENGRAYELSASCEQCLDYSEILGRRRSSMPFPEGAEAADWVYEYLFGEEEEKTYGSITDDVDNHKVGFGIAFVRNPRDSVYHAYIVVRFSRRPADSR